MDKFYALDPYAKTAADYDEPPAIRRLIVWEFNCPLCGAAHQSEDYITLDADNLDDYVAALRKLFAQDGDFINRIAVHRALRAHDYPDAALDTAMGIVQAAVKEGLFNWNVTFDITPETIYTCDSCGAEFETIGHYREHCGVDVISGRPYDQPACRV